VILVVGPMVAIAKLGVVHAAVKHALWVIPAFEPGLGMIGEGHRDLSKVEPLLKRIPSDAEGVLVVTPPMINGEGLLAFSNHEVVAAGQGNIPRDDDTIRKINDTLKSTHYLLLDPIQMVIDRDITVAASDKWKSKVDPAPGGLSTALRRELERSPNDATWVMAFTPKSTRDAKTTRAGAIWMVARDKNVVFEARMEMLDVRRAYEFLTEIRTLKADQLPVSAECKPAVQKLLDHVELAQIGNVVDARVTVSESVRDDLMRCLD
jgi:hypothetical protein